MKKTLFTFFICLLNTLASFGIEEVILPDFSEEKEVKKGFVEKIVTPKTVVFENSFLNDATLGVNYKGASVLNAGDEFHSNYPFFFEIMGAAHFGENKNAINISIVPTRETEHFDRKFLGAIGNLYYKRKLGDKHSVLIGNSRTPMGWEGGVSEYVLDFVERSQIANHFGNFRSLGVRFQGDLGYVDYDLGGYSSTRFLQHPTEGAEFVGWVNYKPFYNQEGSYFKNLKFGAGLNYGRNEGNYTVANFGAHWDYGKWAITAEGALAQGSNAIRYNPDKQQGVNATLKYKLTDKIDILGRYDVFDPDTNCSDDLITQYTAGVNYNPFKERLRFMLNYVFEKKEADNRNIIMFLTQIMI
jgi:hypothetical protein